MWPFKHLLILTFLAAAAVVTIACGGFYLSGRFLGHRTSGRVITATLALAICTIFSVSLNQLWGARRDRDQRVWIARTEHLERLRVLLRAESRSLDGIAQDLRDGRYFTQVADDARRAVWRDDTLTTDVERHFPEYYRERERLIRDILQYDSELGQIRQMVSTTLQLATATEPYRSDLVAALVNKCGGAAPGVSLVRLATDSPGDRLPGYSPGSPHLIATHDAIRVYEQYRCTVDLARMCQALLDRAADLADAASLASEGARRYAEETVLHGSCTYAPGE